MSDLPLLDWQPQTKSRKRGPETSKAAARRAQPGCSRQCGRAPREFTPEFIEQVRLMREAGQTLGAIQKRLAIGHPLLRRLMQEHAIGTAEAEQRKVRVDGDLAYVPLTKGYTAVVDAVDLPIVGDWKWCASIRYDCTGNVMCVYAQRRVKTSDGTATLLRLHRAILDPGKGFDVDHIDSDGLNNRRSNLRAATRAQNTMNRRLQRTNKSGVKGVYFEARTQKWAAKIKADGQTVWLGRYERKEKAAEIYALACARLHQEFARLA